MLMVILSHLKPLHKTIYIDIYILLSLKALNLMHVFKPTDLKLMVFVTLFHMCSNRSSLQNVYSC